MGWGEWEVEGRAGGGDDRKELIPTLLLCVHGQSCTSIIWSEVWINLKLRFHQRGHLTFHTASIPAVPRPHSPAPIMAQHPCQHTGEGGTDGEAGQYSQPPMAKWWPIERQGPCLWPGAVTQVCKSPPGLARITKWPPWPHSEHCHLWPGLMAGGGRKLGLHGATHILDGWRAQCGWKQGCLIARLLPQCQCYKTPWTPCQA